MTKCLTIIRGLPGSGKSTYAVEQWPTLTPAYLAPKGCSPVSTSADHFFASWETGKYLWEGHRIGEAFVWENVQLIQALRDGVPEIIRDNTHSRVWEYEVAEELARTFGYEVKIVDLFDDDCSDEELAERNIHGVPNLVIAGMRERWETDSRSLLLPRTTGTPIE